MNANKALLALVVGMGVVIVLAAGVLSYGLVRRSSDPGFRFFAQSAPGEATAVADLKVALPPETTVISVGQSGKLLLVHTVDEDGESTVLYLDPSNGHIVRRILFTSP